MVDNDCRRFPPQIFTVVDGVDSSSQGHAYPCVKHLYGCLDACAEYSEDGTPSGGPGIYSKTMQCHWESWTAANDKTLVLIVQDGECPDMDACVKTAKLLNNDVIQIIIRDLSIPQRTINLYQKHKGQWINRP